MTAPRPLGRKIVVGRGKPARGAHSALAVRLFDLAREMGFSGVRIETSGVFISNSRYVSFDDQDGRRWKIRLSNHNRPARADTPNLDIISCDGIAGYDEARAFMAGILAGEIEWFDASRTARRLCSHQLKRFRR